MNHRVGIILLFGVFFALLLSFAPRESARAEETAEQLCRSAALHLEARELSLALEEFTKAVATHPQSPCGYLGAGRVYRLLDEPLEGIAVLKRGLEALPGSARIRLDLAELYVDLQRFESAERHYEVVLADEPAAAERRVPALVGLGILYSKKGDFTRARETLEEALATQPRSLAARYNLGLVLSREGDLAAALGELQRALEIDDGEAMAHYACGSCLEKLGRLEDARRALARAIELEPSLAPAHYRLGKIELRLGRTEEGSTSLRRFRQLKAAVHYQRGEVLRKRSDRRGAIRAYERSLDAHPGLVDAHARLGLLYLEEQDGPRSLRHTLEAARLDPGPARFANVAWIYFRAGRRREALKWIDRALERDPQRRELVELRSRILKLERDAQ